MRNSQIVKAEPNRLPSFACDTARLWAITPYQAIAVRHPTRAIGQRPVRQTKTSQWDGER
jgi:hypothetical protein